MQVPNNCESPIFCSYCHGFFQEKEPDEVFLDPKKSFSHDLEFWYTQLQRKMMGDFYFLISGFGIFKK